jgi:hypothetical protein
VNEITVAQIANMKHCIGFRGDRVKRGKYVAYRNYFTTADDNESWDDLVSRGMANKRPHHYGVGKNPQVYSLSEKGIEFLAKLLGVKIVEMD